ncbi:MAG: hypothetical protein JO316_16695 [Abitibacteriaceae bacterium]|nr:hypothetical protein [Abditibacteriaceae bacterium]
MEKVNRLGWAAGLSLKTYGVRIGIRANNAQTLERMLAALPPDWKVSSQPVVERLYSVIADGAIATQDGKSRVRRFNLLYGDWTRLARSLEADQVFEALENDMQLYVAEHAPRRVFVHAGVVAWDGQAIVVPGRSFTGKTTLVTALVQAGATYYSDEYAVLDAQGRVHPYARPLSIRGAPTEKPTRHSAASLGGRVGRQPLPVGLVVLSEYKDKGKWKPRQVSAGQGALGLLANTVSARRQPETVMATLQQVVPYARILQGVRGDAQETAQAILRSMGA